MTARIVTYTDPPWLIEDGKFDSGLATVEREVLGADVDLRFGPHAEGRYQITSPQMFEQVSGSEILVVYRRQVTAELLDAAGPRLRGVVRQGVGIDNLNVPLLTERGLFGYHVPDYCVDEVTAHTASLALALERRLIPQHQTLKGGTFDIYAGGAPYRISRRTLGIVGFGRIGRAVAAKLGAFYGEVLVYDPHVGRDLAEGYRAKAVDTLQELLSRSHAVVLHCPLDEVTERLIGADELRCMRPDAYLLNTARGKLVDPVALGTALNEGWIAGAGIDVFHPENPHDDPEWKPVLEHPGTVVTSHRAFLSEDAEGSSRRRVAELVRDRLAHRVPTVGLLSEEAART
ncbi:C-terminal binding protein [Streptomyces sp. NPDC058623]|uniref:C-terminal binding protein n=1 Tax=Streptomyces sp. NPDC058623 TaxID=3346563 RepID=UPI003655E51F